MEDTQEFAARLYCIHLTKIEALVSECNWRLTGPIVRFHFLSVTPKKKLLVGTAVYDEDRHVYRHHPDFANPLQIAGLGLCAC
jgi:hypothetical protein